MVVKQAGWAEQLGSETEAKVDSTVDPQVVARHPAGALTVLRAQRTLAQGEGSLRVGAPLPDVEAPRRRRGARRAPRARKEARYWPGQKPQSASWPQLVQLTGTATVPWLPQDGQSKVFCASNPNEA